MRRSAIAILILGCAAVGAYRFLDRAPPEIRFDPPPPPASSEESGPEIEAPPTAIDAASFRRASAAERLAIIAKIFADHDPTAAYRLIAPLLDRFDPQTERKDLAPLVDALLTGLFENPESVAAAHADLREPVSETRRLVTARILYEAYREGWYLEPCAEAFLIALESSENSTVRRTLTEDVAELHDFEVTHIVLESVLLDTGDPEDVDAALIAAESLLDSQKKIRGRLAANQPLHPGVEGVYRDPDEVPDSTPFVLELLADTALNRKQNAKSLGLILDLLVHLNGKRAVDRIHNRMRQPELRPLIDLARAQLQGK